MANSKTSWEDYNLAGSGAPPRPRLQKTLELYFKDMAGSALDLGCGGGRDTRELLRRGWKVEAVDSDASALSLMTAMISEFPKLSVVNAAFENLFLPPETFDLINASYSLPFCPPEDFNAFWERLWTSLRPEGVLSCELFGKNDAWCSSPKMTFFDHIQVQALLKNQRIEELTELEEEGRTFAGPTKHWHLFTLIARKSGPSNYR
jgi:SAM-dependent methyltransferase